jgi:hypothetical protein
MDKDKNPKVKILLGLKPLNLSKIQGLLMLSPKLGKTKVLKERNPPVSFLGFYWGKVTCNKIAIIILYHDKTY